MAPMPSPVIVILLAKNWSNHLELRTRNYTLMAITAHAVIELVFIHPIPLLLVSFALLILRFSSRYSADFPHLVCL